MRGSREKAVSPHQGWQNQKFYHFPNTITTAKSAWSSSLPIPSSGTEPSSLPRLLSPPCVWPRSEPSKIPGVFVDSCAHHVISPGLCTSCNLWLECPPSPAQPLSWPVPVQLSTACLDITSSGKSSVISSTGFGISLGSHSPQVKLFTALINVNGC